MAHESISLETLRKANNTLKEALDPPPANDRERDGAIQRFEYTVELSWRIIRKYLLKLGQGDVSASPRPLIRSAHQEGWITDAQQWLNFIEARNLTSHSYKNHIAEQVFAEAKRFPPFVDQLIAKLETVK